ncbi:hypothetical protein KSP39_PZI022263 [Platanthera zijinensis]|uniref:TFIIS central domain-containing protein n=1 Tax=Platanthera zijinensis TaxID=2320716 RepID=A0AAP0AV17_9ASPA
MISKIATPQPSSTSKHSGQADLLSSTTAMSINFGPQQLPLDGGKFSQAMAPASNHTSHGTFPLAFQNKQSIDMALSSKRDQLPVSVQSGTKPLPRVQNEASVNIGTSFPFTYGKPQTQMGSLQKLQTTSTMVVAGSHHLSSINKRPAMAEVPAKVQGEDESVRSKLRESLSSALDTGSKEQNKSKAQGKKNIVEEEGLLKQAEATSHKNEIHPTAVDGSPRETSNCLSFDKQDKNFDGNRGLFGDAGSGASIGERKEDDTICNVQDGQQKHDIVLDEVSYSHSTMEDELLQGHGLSWASDFTSVNEDSVLHSLPKRPKFVPVEENKDVKDIIIQTYANLAGQIEAELFKFFGGVNKKYKEKGRSLLFNLKDPSNPELRERVLSGDLSPRRLCSMTAEELASKELSQWRQAKAEEFAHMVLLPDMNVDIRRLVRKTHKGEFQVEVEQDDGAHPEVGLGLDVLSVPLAKGNEVDQGRPRSNFTGPTLSRSHDSEVSREVVQGDKSDSDERNVFHSSDPRFSEKTDYIQDFIVEEMKDTELLPPVVSLDEFMQALDSEPPFENLEVDNLQENSSPVDGNLPGPESIHVSESDGVGHDVGSTPDISPSKASANILGSQSHNDHFQTKHTKENFSNSQAAHNYQKVDDELKIETDYEKQVLEIAESAPNCSSIWEGFLQLNVCALSNVISFFLSGEKTSVQGWPNFLEVKGRVRLDAFEKFLQELPLSRSRAIMIVEFRWKEDSPESGQLYLAEAIHSYIADERVGFAEPAAGVELYLCPPHSKLTSMLRNHLSKDLLDNVDRVVNGLVGIVVWRRPHPTIVPPSVSAHQNKHAGGGGSKRQSGGSKKQQEGRNRLLAAARGNPTPPQEDIDDIPPGFGPHISRDAEDLPEFDFSRSGKQHFVGRTIPGPAAAAAHVRELIQKYGQGGGNVRELGIPLLPWNEEDDIPEWNPNHKAKQMHVAQSQLMPPHQLHAYQQPQHFMMNQLHVQPVMQRPNGPFLGALLRAPVQPHTGVMQQSPTNLWWPAAQWMPDGVMLPGGSIRPCHFGGYPSGGPRMVHGLGGANNDSGSWRPDNSGSCRPDNSGSRGFF